jgi:hypothetical protein
MWQGARSQPGRSQAVGQCTGVSVLVAIHKHGDRTDVIHSPSPAGVRSQDPTAGFRTCLRLAAKPVGAGSPGAAWHYWLA